MRGLIPVGHATHAKQVWDIVGIAILGAILFTFSLLWFERSLRSAS